MDDAHPVAFPPAPMVFFSRKALLSHVGSREGRSYAQQLKIRSMPDGEEAISYLLVGGRSGSEKPKPVRTPVGSVATSKRKPSYHPRLLDHPMSARPASHPSPRRLASLNKGHRRAVESLVWASVVSIVSARCKAISSMKFRLWRTERLN